MKTRRIAIGLVVVCCILTWSVRGLQSQGQSQSNSVQIHMVITDQALNDDREVPVLRQDNVQVKVGKEKPKVEHLIPAQSDSAALQLFLLIDDTCEPTAIGSNLNDLREFITAQPASTAVGVGYMSNATVQLAQDFTADHTLAAKAVRLPRGTSSTMDSPYLSLAGLAKGWPQQKLRREVLIISDGVDRLRGDTTGDVGPPNPFPSVDPRGRMSGTPGFSTLPTISADADIASRASQRYGIIVHSIYATGVGRLSRNAWEAQLGQGGIAKIADETGGEYFALGTQNAVSFKPYLERLQKILENQYFLVFQVTPRKKGELQRVRISTEVANADIAAADNVWVPANGG
jgi:hypothetical protein